MRCPDCQATNPDTAPFCGQCYRRFDASPAAPVPVVEPQTAEPAAPQPAPAAAPPPAHPVQVGRFAAGAEGLTWRCAVCHTTQPLDRFTCETCGARMDDEAGPTGPGAADLADARRAERLLPGLGHVRAGQSGMGVSRMGITALWILGVVLLAAGGARGLLAASPMLLGIAVIWATGPDDVAAAAAGRAPRLDARRFMYLVIGVTTGVIAAGGLVVIL